MLETRKRIHFLTNCPFGANTTIVSVALGIESSWKMIVSHCVNFDFFSLLWECGYVNDWRAEGGTDFLQLCLPRSCGIWSFHINSVTKICTQFSSKLRKVSFFLLNFYVNVHKSTIQWKFHSKTDKTHVSIKNMSFIYKLHMNIERNTPNFVTMCLHLKVGKKRKLKLDIYWA